MPNVPDWTNRNVHDPGITLVALPGFAAAGLTYVARRRSRRSRTP